MMSDQQAVLIGFLLLVLMVIMAAGILMAEEESLLEDSALCPPSYQEPEPGPSLEGFTMMDIIQLEEEQRELRAKEREINRKRGIKVQDLIQYLPPTVRVGLVDKLPQEVREEFLRATKSGPSMGIGEHPEKGVFILEWWLKQLRGSCTKAPKPAFFT